MKKLLIATSAVVGLGVVSADFAAAQVETSFGGNVRVRLSKGAGTDARPSLTHNRTVLNWTATGTTDAGLSYGAYAEIQAQQGTTIGPDGVNSKKGNIFASGGFGKVTIGDQGTAGVAGGAQNATAGTGGYDGAHSVKKLLSDKGDATALTHKIDGGMSPDFVGVGYTGTFNGVTAHVAYTGDDDGKKSTGKVKNAMWLGVGYGGSFGNGSFNVGVGYYKASLDDTTKNNRKNMGIGADVTFGPVTVGLSYANGGKSNANKSFVANTTVNGQKAIILAAKYNFGAGNVGISYHQAKANFYGATSTSANVNAKSNLLSLGADYTIAPGWNVAGDYYRLKNSAGGVSGKSENAFALQTQVSF